MKKKWNPNCETCGEPKRYSKVWDAFWCWNCLKWLEGKCSDPQCYFNCANRPEFPNEDVTNESQ